MNDMTAVIQAKSDQWNAADFGGGPKTFTIKAVSIKPGQDQPVAIDLEGCDKLFRPCKSVARVLVAAWGPDAKAYVGRSMTLYLDPKVRYGGMEVGGIRVSHLSHIEKDMTMVLTESQKTKKPVTIRVLTTQRQTPKSDPIYDSEWVADAEREIENATDNTALFEWWENTVKSQRADLYKANKQAYGALKAKLDAKLSELGG